MRPKKSSKPMKVLLCGDFHCGHRVGLTPPMWNPKFEAGREAKYSWYRGKVYEWWLQEMRAQGPYDVCVGNADLIEGKGGRNGGIELIYPDRTRQIGMAKKVLEDIDAKSDIFTYGTGYHVGTEDDWETPIAEAFGGDIRDVQNLDLRGLMTNVRHHIGGSQSPVGGGTPLVRTRIWNALWADREEYPRASLIVRSHIHSYAVWQDRLTKDVVTVMTLPALQGYGSNFGARRMEKPVDVGFVVLEIQGKEDWKWTPSILRHTGALSGAYTSLS